MCFFQDLYSESEFMTLTHNDNKAFGESIAGVQIIQLLQSKKQIILYGPPGTGKTFNTKRIAVSLMDGFEDINDLIEYDELSDTESEGAKRVINSFLTENEKLNLEYWTTFKNFLDNKGSFIKCPKPYPQNFTRFAIKSDFSLFARVNTQNKTIYVVFVISGKNRLDHYKILERKYKNQIEQQLNMKLIWREVPETAQCKIESTQYKADIKNENDWEKQHDWIKTTVEAFHRVFSPIIEKLDEL